jgi:hypothetical protein
VYASGTSGGFGLPADLRLYPGEGPGPFARPAAASGRGTARRGFRGAEARAAGGRAGLPDPASPEGSGLSRSPRGHLSGGDRTGRPRDGIPSFRGAASVTSAARVRARGALCVPSVERRGAAGGAPGVGTARLRVGSRFFHLRRAGNRRFAARHLRGRMEHLPRAVRQRLFLRRSRDHARRPVRGAADARPVAGAGLADGLRTFGGPSGGKGLGCRPRGLRRASVGRGRPGDAEERASPPTRTSPPRKATDGRSRR